jgi:23S rRNA pseudouridine1911/1915/1917 synthase
MAYINHPIVGDGTYSNNSNKFNINKQLLHAIKLGFNHPRTKEYMEFETEIPENFNEVLKTLR